MTFFGLHCSATQKTEMWKSIRQVAGDMVRVGCGLVQGWTGLVGAGQG